MQSASKTLLARTTQRLGFGLLGLITILTVLPVIAIILYITARGLPAIIG